jgi:hypothetical protein
MSGKYQFKSILWKRTTYEEEVKVSGRTGASWLRYNCDCQDPSNSVHSALNAMKTDFELLEGSSLESIKNTHD